MALYVWITLKYELLNHFLIVNCEGCSSRVLKMALGVQLSTELDKSTDNRVSINGSVFMENYFE